MGNKLRSYKNFNDESQIPNANPQPEPNQLPPNPNQPPSINSNPFLNQNHQNLPNQPQNNLPLNPFSNPYGYRENLGVNYLNKNQSNEKNKIYIARSCFGNYINKEFHSALTFNRIPEKEFESEMHNINKVVSNFTYIKCLYVLMIIMLVISLAVLITGISLNPYFTVSNYSQKYLAQYIESQDLAFNLVTAFGLMLILLTIGVFSMALICKLKKYEFLLASHFNKINRDSYMTRNVYWKIGGFCRFIELNILPIQPEFIWFLQTKSGKDVEINNIKEILKN